ncbi:ribokinase [Halocella sp. SP3-1]|uniref:ribokinase n=1 Tax=Halocella sp. SP3-1 TaxID=2382161 RepID=UPI000F756099|nr:ribokinase [Halocella sp. SP3-1]AZO96268.1 ribokinase [Halocella sp. SP3-1]
MKILNFGSLNIDYVYSVEHIVNPGETINSTDLEVFPGGKGLNQSVALARAGVQVYHAGIFGEDGDIILNVCKKNNINIKYLKTVSQRTGNAIIQVSNTGQNSIVLFGGANHQNSKEYVDEVLSDFGEDDIILLQNEINLLDYIIERAYEKKIKIILNLSPINTAIFKCDLRKIGIFIMNEVEGRQITGKKETNKILNSMKVKYPAAKVVLTLGKDGVIYQDGEKTYTHGIYKTKTLDTTAAGDTFTGYFIAMLVQNYHIEEVLRIASVASSLAVAQKGASRSIPKIDDVLRSKLEYKNN